MPDDIRTLTQPDIMRALLSFLLVATLVVLSEGYQGCPDIDPLDHTVHLPHETDCTLFYRCDHGYPKLDRCPATLHFNPTLQVCDWPDQAGCTAGEGQSTSTPPPEPESTIPPAVNCSALPTSQAGVWTPSSCVVTSSSPQAVCTLSCDANYELAGGRLAQCTQAGWVGVNGLNQIPACKAIADLGEAFIGRINETLHARPANLVFLLDESGSLYANEFAMEVQFMKAIVSAFPLGHHRSAGTITFETSAMVDISVSTDDSCSFMAQADIMRYAGGATNILAALQLAITEVADHGVHNFTLAFLITDGVSYTDPHPAAEHMKSSNFALFTVGIGSFDTDQLRGLASKDSDGVPIFFPIQNFGVFQKVAEYLNTAYNPGGLNCDSSSFPPTATIPS